jgi:hypothetical protein
MPEILTESFCERCGTRYTFESAAPRKTRRLGQIRTLSKGMKNWVMSDDMSRDEAMAAARNDDERELTSQQLDAFHSTFNFCMTCRQYTCANCWNTAEGRCLTCAPHLGHEILAAPFPEQVGPEAIRLDAAAWPELDLSTAAATNGLSNGATNGHGAHLEEPADPWGLAGTGGIEEIPEIDPAARLAFLSGDTLSPTPVTEPETNDPPASAGISAPAEVEAAADAVHHVGTVDEVGPVDAGAAGPVAEPSASRAPAPAAELAAPQAVDGTASAAAARTSELLRRFRPGQNIDAELAAYEAELDQPAAASAATEEPAAPVPVAVAAAGGEAGAPPAAAGVEAATSEATTFEVAASEAEVPAARTAARVEPVAPEEPVAKTVPARPSLAWPTIAQPIDETPSEPVAAGDTEPTAAEPVHEPALAAEAHADESPRDEPRIAEAAEAAAVAPVAAEEIVADAPLADVPSPEPGPVTGESPTPDAESAPTAPAPTPDPAPVGPWPVAADGPAAPVEPARDDRIQQPTWQIFAPDGMPAPPATPAPPSPLDGGRPHLPVQPAAAASADPQWPVRPDQAESPAMALLANRSNRSLTDALWAASAQEVLARPPAGTPAAAASAGVQPCSSCGLSLSATARFCRRCGTRQG